MLYIGRIKVTEETASEKGLGGCGYFWCKNEKVHDGTVIYAHTVVLLKITRNSHIFSSRRSSSTNTYPVWLRFWFRRVGCECAVYSSHSRSLSIYTLLR